MNENINRLLKVLDDPEIDKLWEDVYEERLLKTGSIAKANISSNARVYAVCLKRFIEGEI